MRIPPLHHHRIRECRQQTLCDLFLGDVVFEVGDEDLVLEGEVFGGGVVGGEGFGGEVFGVGGGLGGDWEEVGQCVRSSWMGSWGSWGLELRSASNVPLEQIHWKMRFSRVTFRVGWRSLARGGSWRRLE
jgi:hypothetical protein